MTSSFPSKFLFAIKKSSLNRIGRFVTDCFYVRCKTSCKTIDRILLLIRTVRSKQLQGKEHNIIMVLADQCAVLHS